MNDKSQRTPLSLSSRKKVCPACGDFVGKLDEYTGWCSKCTVAAVVKLGRKQDQLAQYLEANADKLEHYMAEGHSLYQAIDLLADPRNGHRPSCVVCGVVIKHAPRNSIFCRTTPTCRRYSRRYIYLYTKKDMTKTQALATVLEQLTGE